MLSAIWETSLAFAPFLLLGAALSALLHVLLPDNWLRRHLRGRLGVLKAVAFGIPLPLCSCGVIPAGLGLRRDGASRGAAVGFMISTPQTGVDSILVSASMLGMPFALFKVAAALVTGLVGGLLTNAWVAESADEQAAAADGHGTSGTAWRRAWDHGLMLLQSVWRWVVFGIVASAALNALVPQSVWQQLSALHPAWSMLGALVISVPLYVCATASVPIAASLVAGGLPAGAALVFLMAGPATNVATLGAIYRTLGAASMGIYLAVVVLFSLGLGAAFDSVLPTQAAAAHVHGSGEPWEWVLAGLMWLLMAYFFFSELRSFWRARVVAARMATPVELTVAGMTCNGCVRKLERALQVDPRVKRAAVTLSPPRARVEGRLSPQQVADLVTAAGYQPVSATQEVLELEVAGMTCNGCVRKLEQALQADPRVVRAAVSFSPPRARVEGALQAQDVVELVSQAGFEAVTPALKSQVVELTVEGLTCGGCVRKLEGALRADTRVEEATVTLDPQRVRVYGALTLGDVRDIVQSAGFRAGTAVGDSGEAAAE